MSGTAVPQKTAATEGQARWFVANLATVVLTGEDTGGRFDLVEMVGAKGDMPPLHVHHTHEETFHVLEGDVTVFVGGDEIRAGEGATLQAPRGVPHVYRVESDFARMLVISSPAGFADFVLEASTPAEARTLPPGPPAIGPEALTAIAARYEIEIFGPPGTLPS